MSKLVCKGISKKYKDKLAVKNVDLTLESGKIYGLIGRNGAGKSTLLSLMSAQAPLTEGSVEIDGERVWDYGDGASGKGAGPFPRGNGRCLCKIL